LLESFDLKLKSKQLLEIAKIGVEKAIETDEATATDWINQQFAILGIDINNGGENKN
jgi:type I restriction enzyme M protein